jgi:hypothetical protein
MKTKKQRLTRLLFPQIIISLGVICTASAQYPAVNPLSGLVEGNNKFYGVTSFVGAQNEGVYEWDPATTVYATLHDFDSATGRYPSGDVILPDNKLYGTTDQLLKSVHCMAAPSGITNWWPGDGNANDIRGSGDGITEPGVDFPSAKVGQAFRFDGQATVSVPDDPHFTLGSDPFTIDLWVNFSQLQGRDPFIGHDEGEGEVNKWIFWYDEEGHDQLSGVPALRFHINSPQIGPLDPVAAPWNPQTGQWYHVAVTRLANNYSLYIDGVQVATQTNTLEIPDPHVDLTIGSSEIFFLDGLIDEVEIFERALTAAEIRSIYDAGNVGKCKQEEPTLGPVVYSLTLIDPVSDMEIADMYNGIEFNVNDRLNIRSHSNELTQSVAFFINGKRYWGENQEPYALFGDRNGDYNRGRFKPGEYTVTVIPYSENFHTGTTGESKSVSFKVTDDNGSTQATPFAELNVFPNPFTEYATIEIDGEPNAPIAVKIVDQFGNSVKTINESLNGSGWLVKTLDAQNLGSGTYFLTIKIDKETCTKRIVIK